MKKTVSLFIAVVCLIAALYSCGGTDAPGVSEPVSDVSSAAEVPEQSSAASEQSGVIDIPWEAPEDVENPSQGLELAETYSKEFGDCYIVVGIGTCEDTDIVIPSTVNGKPVVEIADEAFLRNNKIKSVYCGNHVKKIGKAAFNRCSNLKKAVIPESVEIIEEEAFSWCGLTELEIGGRVSTMGRGVFQMNTSLRSVKLPLSLTIIPESAFSSCSALVDVELSPNVVSIADRAFSSTALIAIRLPDSVENINPTAFNSDLTKMPFQSFEVDEGNPYLCTIDGVLYSKDMSTLIAYPQARGAYTVLDGVKIIDVGAFFEITYEVTLPASVRTLSKKAFFGHYQGHYTVNVKNGISFIDDFAFTCVEGRVTINFEGTKEEWNAIGKSEHWYLPYEGFGNQKTTVKCSDGDLTFEYNMFG